MSDQLDEKKFGLGVTLFKSNSAICNQNVYIFQKMWNSREFRGGESLQSVKELRLVIVAW